MHSMTCISMNVLLFRKNVYRQYWKGAMCLVLLRRAQERRPPILAQQIDQAMQGFSYYLPDVSSVAVYGGNDGNRYDQEMKSMRLGADVIIATPGRLISHISMGNIDLSRVSFFVLDEADRMLDMGFSEDIMKIASKLPANCQTIMFSATMPKDIEKMAQNLLKNPVEIKLAVSKPAEKIQQSAYICYETQKLQIIKDIFKAGDLKRVIIFSGSKMKVKQINQALTRMKINSGEMHSDLDQAQRDEMMFKFKSGQIDVLVATDILARGIDIDDIAMVINYDVPHDAEDYVHRIGRTARADRDGVAITFVNEDDMFAFHQIEKFLDKDITKNPLPADCGEGPEYTTSRRPGKTSAKNRRRKDRDNTSHRDTKQRNRNRNNGEAGENNRRRNNDEKENEKTTGQEGAVPMSNKNNRGRHRSRNGQTADVKETNARQENGQERGSHNNRSNNRNNARPVNGGKPAERQNRQRGNKQRQRQAEKPVNAKNMVVAANQSRSQKNNDNNGIGSILRHPLRWIKSLGKK